MLPCVHRKQQHLVIFSFVVSSP